MRADAVESLRALRARVRRDAVAVLALIVGLAVLSLTWELPERISGHEWEGGWRQVAGHVLVVVAGAHAVMLWFGHRRARDLKRAVRHNEHLALHDPLTGLANRLLFVDRLEQALARSRRSQELTGVLMIDLDGFKAVNDRYGHLAGDALLRQVGQRLLALTRDSDTVARIGGDEFVVLITGASEPVSVRRATTRLAGAFDEPFDVGGHPVRISPSIGLVVEDSSVAPDDLLRRADQAMYAAKRSGGGISNAG